MTIRLIVAGIGGQGVVYATKVLSHAGLLRGERVIASENHGMSQRGGSVMSHLRIGGSDAALVRKGSADALVALDRVEAVRNLTFVRPGGSVFVNTAHAMEPPLGARLRELAIRVGTIDADARAGELGSPTRANLVLLGFAAAHSAFGVTADELRAAVRAIGPPEAVDLNLRALEAGAQAATVPA
jgi:indolepyruvate ferredoxin oxidoreductase beta subunit